MMQRAGAQGTENPHTSNPLGGPTTSGITGASSKSSGGLPNFSLLGQQLSSSFASISSNQNQHPHPQSQPSNLSSEGSMNFPLNMQTHAQHFSQGHQGQQQASQAQGSVNNGGEGGGFAGMPQNVSALGVQGQGFNGGNQQFLGQQQTQQHLQPQPQPQPQQQQQQQQHQHQSQPQPQSVESLMTALNAIKEKITQLQAFVPYMSQNSQMPSGAVHVQQQAAAAISQIAQVAANMFPTGSQQAPHQAPHQPPHGTHQAPHQAHHGSHQAPHQPLLQGTHQTPLQNQQQQQQQQAQVQVQAQPQLQFHASQPPQQQQQQLQQSQSHQQTMPMAAQPFFGSGVTQGQPSFNFFQGGNGSSASANGSGLGNHFGSSQGVGPHGNGVSMDLQNASAQKVEGGILGNATSANGSGMNIPSKGASAGGPGYGASAPTMGGTSGPNVSSALVVMGGRQTSPLRSQAGGGMGNNRGVPNPDISHLTRTPIPAPNTGRASTPMEDRDEMMGSRDDDDDGDNEALAPGSYDLVELDAIEILAEHTHFCEMCGKGFKRDANLRMHMRGHGDEFKTAAALARPDKASHELSAVRQRRYSCPYSGCKRNKKHRKFQPLKTMLCVKNHYRRSHCPKILTCNKCKTKKFSVVADLKTHEKHCGCDKWQCSCGTTFSRKDKLIGHIALFVGHKPADGDMDTPGALDGGEMTPANLSGGPNAGSNASGYGMSATGAVNPGNQPIVGCGSGMGLSENSMQGLSSRGNSQGGNTLTMPKDGSVLVPDNSSSSDSFPSSGLSNSMFPNLFNNNFLQTSSGGNSSPDGLH